MAQEHCYLLDAEHMHVGAVTPLSMSKFRDLLDEWEDIGSECEPTFDPEDWMPLLAWLESQGVKIIKFAATLVV